MGPPPDRESILRQVREKKLSRAKAAKMLGLSRQYVGQLVKKKPATAPASPVYVPPKEVPSVTTAPPPAPPPQPLPAPEDPKGDGAPSLKSILDAAGAGSPGYSPDAPSAPPVAPPPPPGPGAPAMGYDPKDAEAGRALIAEGQLALGETIAVYGFGLKSGDPRFAEFQKTNAFLKVSLERNDENIAVLGKLTKGLFGLCVGTFLEILRMARVARSIDAPPADERPRRQAASPASDPGTVDNEPGASDEGGGDGPAFSISRARAAAESASASGLAPGGLERAEDDEDPEPGERFTIAGAKLAARGS